jgi:hypothetical protein
MLTIRTYSELRRLETLEERYSYLRLTGVVGEPTFGFDRYINQAFYKSKQWANIRHHIIARDLGCDLGVEGFEIHSHLIVHHMNPMAPIDITEGGTGILDPEFLITTTLRTHNAIHFGDEQLLPRQPVVRTPGDTKLW